MKTLITLGKYIVLIAGIIFLIVPLFLPKKLKVSYSEEINSPKSSVAEEFYNLKNLSNIQSFLVQDSLLSKLFLDTYKGKNANFKWSSADNSIGSGEMLLTYASEDSIVNLIQRNETQEVYQDYYTFKKLSPNVTQLNWYREGPEVGYFNRYKILWNEGIQKKEVYQSIQNLMEVLDNKVVEISDEVKPGKINKEYYEGGKYLVKEEEIDMDARKLNYTYKSNFNILNSYINQSKNKDIIEKSKPISIISKWDTVKKESKIDFGYSINGEITHRPNTLVWKSIPPTEVFTYIYQGNFSDITKIQEKLFEIIKNADAIPTNYFWIEELDADLNKDTLMLKAYQSVRM